MTGSSSVIGGSGNGSSGGGGIGSVNGTFWGQNWTNGGDVGGSISAGANGGFIDQFHAIELNNAGSLSGYGGYIDFHFDGNSADYTSRIIEDSTGQLHFDCANGIRIGDGVIVWDSTNNALKVIKADGTAGNIYATGGVSALGMSAGVSSMDAMTFVNVTAEKYYLDSTHYLYLDSGVLKYNDNGTVRTVAFV